MKINTNKFYKTYEPAIQGVIIVLFLFMPRVFYKSIEKNFSNYIITVCATFLGAFFAACLTVFINKYRGNSAIYLNKFIETFIKRENFILRNPNFSIKDDKFLELHDEILSNYKILSIYFLNEKQLKKLEVFVKDYKAKTSNDLIKFIKEEVSI